MAKTLRIGSKVHTPLRISPPLPNPEKPGDAPEMGSFVINPAPFVGGEGYTDDVPADMYKAWLKANANHPAVLAGHLREVDAEEDANADVEFGFEPGLDAAADDKDNTKAAKKGSRVKDKGPVSSEDMAATSDTPNDDSPRSQTNF